MKKILFVAVLLMSSLTAKLADAQVRISLGLNIGSQPDWGPTGYDHAEYYYMPDIDSYYSVVNHDYIYNSGGRWIHAGNLPSRYSNYDLYNGYKVVVNEPNPWVHADTYRTRYASYRGRRGQTVIRDSRDVKYRNHWNGNNGNGYGRGNDRGRGNAYGRGNDHDRGYGNDRGRGYGNDHDRGHGNDRDRGYGNDRDRGHGNGRP